MILDSLFKKEKTFLRPEDLLELKELERKSYMERARVLIVEQAKQKAEKEIQIKPKDPYA